MKKFWNWIKNSDETRTLRLEGPIDEESFWGDEITPQMFRDELNAGEGDVTVWINSPGGNVFAAAEIYTMLKDYKGSITVKIDAIAASAASVVAMAGDTVQMSPVAMLMIHDPSTIAMGNTKDMEKAIEVLNEVKESIINAYAAMISNETYVGDKCLQKKAPVDYLTKKPDPNRKAMSNYLYDDHEAIIDRETWDKAQAILKERQELAKKGVYKTNREHHFLYGKVFCGECGAPFLRRTFNGSTPYKAWNCRNRQKGKVKCGNRFIREEQLLSEILKELGWSDMDQERFKKEVSRVLVFPDHIEIIKE